MEYSLARTYINLKQHIQINKSYKLYKNKCFVMMSHPKRKRMVIFQYNFWYGFTLQGKFNVFPTFMLQFLHIIL